MPEKQIIIPHNPIFYSIIADCKNILPTLSLAPFSKVKLINNFSRIIPESFTANNFDNARGLMTNAPVLLKPQSGYGGINNIIYDDFEKAKVVMAENKHVASRFIRDPALLNRVHMMFDTDRRVFLCDFMPLFTAKDKWTPETALEKSVFDTHLSTTGELYGLSDLPNGIREMIRSEIHQG